MSEELKINMPLFNINEEAELENNLSFHLDEFTDEIMRTMTRDKDIKILKKVIKKQQAKIKELEKGNRSLMESRIKWKNRYYRERAKNKECISKDKIRAKIEELEKQAKEMKYDYDVSYAEENLFNKNVKFFKEQMQELLEEPKLLEEVNK